MATKLNDAKSIFLSLVEEVSPDQWQRALDERCADDLPLQQQVERLLSGHRQELDLVKQGDDALRGFLATVDETRVVEPIGTRIGPYKLREQIGEGGFGIVYVAEQDHPVKRKVALKLVKPGMDTREIIARFEAERQALALMDHPNIAKVLDAGATELGRPYFVMELVRGVPITDFCDEQKLSLRERLQLFTDVCRAVQHAHQKGIIHRDLKPTNVMVTLSDGKPIAKVIDFGIAKALISKLTEKTVYTAFGQMVGTPLYMSPEQAELSMHDVDTRSDVYSLGVLLYELLTGTTPFDKETLQKSGFDEMRRIIREVEPPRPSARISTLNAAMVSTISDRRRIDPRKFCQSCRGELDWIVMKCLEKDRNRRYETASALAADIGRHLTNEPVTACPPSPGYKFRKFAKRNKTLLVAGSAVAAALVIGLSLSTVLYFRERSAVDIAEANEARASSEAAKSQLVADFMTEMLKGVGPSVAIGRDTTMLREILDQTAVRLNELDGQPAVEADLRSTLGKVYHDLGEYERAEAMHRRALELRKNLQGNEHTDVARSLNDLAQVLYGQGKWRDAELLHRQALNVRHKLLGSRHVDVALSLNHLAESLRRQSNLNEAEVLFHRALDLRRDLLGDDHPDVAQSLNDLGLLQWNQKKYQEAEITHRMALDIRGRCFGDEHPEVARSLDRLGLALRLQGQLTEAEAVGREALNMRVRLLGETHPDVAHSLHNLCTTLRNMGRLEEAEALIREALVIRQMRLGDEHVETGQSMTSLVQILLEAGKLEDLETLQREELTTLRTTYGNEHPTVATALSALADVVRRKGDLDEAGTLTREALTILQNGFGAGHPEVARVLNNLDAMQNEAVMRETLALRRETLGNEHADVALSLHSLAFMLRGDGRLSDAESLYREALDIRRKLGRDEQPHLADTLLQLGLLLRWQDKHDEAESFFREALAVRRECFGDRHQRLASPLYNLAELCHEQQKLSEAEQLYREALEQAAMGHGYPSVSQIVTALQGLLREQNRSDEIEGVMRLGFTLQIESLDEAVTRGDAQAMNNLAWLLATCPDHSIRNSARAIELARKSVELAPKVGGNWNTLGVAQYRAGNWQGAIESLSKADELLGEGALAFNAFFLAMAHWQLGSNEAAHNWYDRAVEWMDQKQPQNVELIQFRAEAAELLGVGEAESNTQRKL